MQYSMLMSIHVVSKSLMHAAVSRQWVMLLYDCLILVMYRCMMQLKLQWHTLELPSIDNLVKTLHKKTPASTAT